MQEDIENISENEDLTKEDYEAAVEILLEADKIQKNPELMKNIEAYAKKKSVEFRSIGDLRKAANEMALNPGQYSAQEDAFAEKKKARLAKKKS